MKNKIIAVDLDGTLALGTSYLSDYTISSIKELTKNGYTFVITTGRSYIGTKSIYDMCELTTPLVLYNGAFVYLPQTDTILYEKNMDRDFIISVVEDPRFCELADNSILEYKNECYILNKINGAEDAVVGNFRNTLKRNPTSFVIRCKNRESQELFKEFIEKKDSRFSYRYWGNHFGEVFYKDLSKKDGIQVVLEYYHKTNKDLIFFGDGQNDIEILQYANPGVAMKNAADFVKNAAQEITEFSNEEDGVIKHLQEKYNI